MSETSSHGQPRDGAMSASLATERIEGDDNVWTRRLVLFLRIMAVLSILKGLYHWAQVTGFIGGEEEAFENQPMAWQAATVYFAVIEPVAAVGLSEEAARQQARKLRVSVAKVPDWYTGRREGEPVYGYKTLIEKESGRILGAHLVGPHADEVINLFGLAIRHDLTIDDLKSTIFAYPTGASDIGYML